MLRAKVFDQHLHPDENELDRLEWNLTNHTPTPEQITMIENLRRAMKATAAAIIVSCPASRERSLALTALEESTMWAVASIARSVARAEVVD